MKSEAEKTLENDLEMLRSGFEFEPGELDWYLDGNVSDELKSQLRKTKKENGI